MSAFTVRRKARFGGFRLGSVDPDLLQAWGTGQSLWTQAEAAKAAALADQGYSTASLALAQEATYAPAEMPTASTSTWKLPLIIGGVAVLGIGGFFLLRKKGKR